MSVALLSEAKKSECGTAQPSSKHLLLGVAMLVVFIRARWWLLVGGVVANRHLTTSPLTPKPGTVDQSYPGSKVMQELLILSLGTTEHLGWREMDLGADWR